MSKAILLALGVSLASAGVRVERDDELRAFAERVRAATAKYQDREQAIADGYRLIGEDFPGMAEHWVHIGLLFDSLYDPEKPEFLSYLTVAGRARLLGVAYGLPLLQGESAPQTPAGAGAWHDHWRTVDDETLSSHHHGAGHAEHGARLAMLHAWVWLENPDGLFAAENWAIPFVRLGLTPPSQAGVAAGKALALLNGGDSYLARAVRAAAAPAPIDVPALESAIGRTRVEVEALVRRQSRAALSREELDELGELWRKLWIGIDALLPPEARAQAESIAMR